MHHRSCCVIKGLAGETFKIQSNIKPVAVEPERNTIIDDIVLLKVGVKLPKSFN